MKEDVYASMIEGIVKSITNCVSVLSVCAAAIKVCRLLKNGEPIIISNSGTTRSRDYDEEVDCNEE